MKSRSEFIKSLPNVKLIIGNGFDLHCHMKTSYKDYFIHDKDKNNYFGSWIENFLPNMDGYLSFNSEYQRFWTPFEHFDKANIWDMFFYINSDVHYGNTKEWCWCDIENMICSWLKDEKTAKSEYKKSHWENVYNIINNNIKVDYEREKIMAAFVFKKHGEKKV